MAEQKIHIKNKKAGFEYTLFDKYTAGIQLLGTEIKSIRAGKASIVEAYCVVENGEIFIRNMHIDEYTNGGFVNHEVRRDRKLLLNRTEINKISKKLKAKGYTLGFVPTLGRAPKAGRTALLAFVIAMPIMSSATAIIG